jgi:hypothetical protein
VILEVLKLLKVRAPGRPGQIFLSKSISLPSLAAKIAAVAKKKKPMATAAELSEKSRQGFETEKPLRIRLDGGLSRNSRWGCGHIYDETPAGIAVYVRNDPINHVDPTGNDALDDTLGYFSYEGLFAYDEAFVEYAIDLALSQAIGGSPLVIQGLLYSVQVPVEDTGEDSPLINQTPLSPPTTVNPGSGSGGGGGTSTQTPSKTTPTTPPYLVDPCTSTVLNALNQRFGSNFNLLNVVNGDMYNGAWNIVISATDLTPLLFNSIQPGRYPNSWMTIISGIGPTLHIVGQSPIGSDFSFNNNNIGITSVTFSAHTDSAYAYHPLGALVHGIIDYLGRNSRSRCPKPGG